MKNKGCQTELLCWLRPFGFRGAVASICLLLAGFAHAAELQDVRYHGQVEKQLEVEFTFDGPGPRPDIAISNEPAQLRLTFPQSHSSLEMSQIPVDMKGIKYIETRPRGSDLDVVIYLEQMTTYQGRLDGRRYLLTLNDNVMTSSVSDVKSPEDKLEPNQFVNRVDDIEFHRGEQGQGQLVFVLANHSTAANLEQKGKDLELVLYNTAITNEHLYMVDVNDFNTLVESFETFKDGLNTRVKLDINGKYEYEYRQEGKRFIVEVAKAAEIVRDEKTYSGSVLSMNFQDIPVRTVLQIIADHNNFNLVTTESVDGNLTLHLDSVPWDQALEMILKVRGLDKRIEGNILLVAPREELAAQESQELRDRQEAMDVAPLYSEYIQINYAKATDVASLLSNESNSLLSDRGSVSVDERTNTLLLQDTAERLEDVHRLVEVLDVPIKQVVIESRMVTVRDSIGEELGVRWGITDIQTRGNNIGITSGSLEATADISQQIADGADSITVPFPDGLNVNLPAETAGAASIAFQVAKLADGTLLDLELSALERENQGEIIANPRLTTANQFTAFIEQGVEIPFVQSTSSGATSVTFKKAVLSLTVTPQITPDDRIVLDLTVTQDTRGETVSTGTGPATAIDTQRISTQVLAENGETIVLGGIYQQQLLNTVDKVPLLGDIPYLGWLFKRSNSTTERTELLIFVTPKILTEEL